MSRRPRGIAGLLFELVRVRYARGSRRRATRMIWFALGIIVALLWFATRSIFCTCGARAVALQGAASARVGVAINVAFSPSIAAGAAGYGVVWLDLRHGRPAVYFARLDAEGQRQGGESRISPESGVRAMPDIVWTGTEYIVGWTEPEQGKWRVWALRVSARGEPQGQPASLTGSDADAFGARLGWNGSHLGVAWFAVHGRTIVARFARFDRELRQQGAVHTLSEGAIITGVPAIRAEGDGFWLAWNEFQASTGATRTWIERINRDAERMGPRLVANQRGVSIQVDVASREANTVVSWRDGIGARRSSVALSVVGADGTPGGRIPVSSETSQAGNASLAYFGDHTVIAWEDDRDGRTSVFSSSRTADGHEQSAPRRIPSAAALAQSPSIVGGVRGGALVWSDYRSRGPAIYFARLGPDGARNGDDVRVSGSE